MSLTGKAILDDKNLSEKKSILTTEDYSTILNDYTLPYINFPLVKSVPIDISISTYAEPPSSGTLFCVDIINDISYLPDGYVLNKTIGDNISYFYNTEDKWKHCIMCSNGRFAFLPQFTGTTNSTDFAFRLRVTHCSCFVIHFGMLSSEGEGGNGNIASTVPMKMTYDSNTGTTPSVNDIFYFNLSNSADRMQLTTIPILFSVRPIT